MHLRLVIPPLTAFIDRALITLSLRNVLAVSKTLQNMLNCVQANKTARLVSEERRNRWQEIHLRRAFNSLQTRKKSRIKCVRERGRRKETECLCTTALKATHFYELFIYVIKKLMANKHKRRRRCSVDEQAQSGVRVWVYSASNLISNMKLSEKISETFQVIRNI